MKRNSGLSVLLAVGLAALLVGCWGSDKSTSLDLTSGANVLSGATAVGIDKCHNCHANTAVGGAGIFLAWEESRHGNLDNTFDAWDNALGTTNYHGFRTTSTGTSCIPCHNPNGDKDNLPFYLSLNTDPLVNVARNVVGCEACHGGGSLHFGVGPIGGPTLGIYAVAASTGQSSQYNTCTGCHDDSHHETSSYRIIGDTHTDNANRAVGSDIQGYVIRKSSDTACVDCHNPHTADMAASGSPNRQWKASAHGDFAGEGWKHYQWTASNRTSCQRCHTTTGLINYLAATAAYNLDNTAPAYDPANNVFSWLGSTATDNSSEMLYCYGCHTNYYGGLRDPGPITASYTGVSPEPVFPDVEGSNICLACHTGRENGDSIKASTGNFANLSFINSHYLTGGATLFGTSGYEYDNVSYANVAYFEHDLIGSTDAPGTGSNGPCVGCHMSSTLNPSDPTQGKHKFLNVGLDNTGSGEIITTPVCAVCHTTYPMTITDLDTAEEEALAGLSILDNVLRARNYFFANSHPYFFKTADNTASANAVKDWTKRYDGSAGDNTIGKMNMGAAFNYNLLGHDPGFFAHNFVYSKRLIYDAIDWMDNNSQDNTVQSYITTTYPSGTTRTNALLYFGASGRP